ncbi:hypothetical protein [Streptomyces sp. NPDC060275]|uniref:hypothetical protein n=1 Tax=Streptomyces sp. NPDC060275 TaxID=3347090 RepID=UPI00365F5441
MSLRAEHATASFRFLVRRARGGNLNEAAQSLGISAPGTLMLNPCRWSGITSDPFQHASPASI